MGLDQGKLLKKILSASSKPIVLDADALNCLAIDRTIWDLIPQGSILTPHLKEFERLFGPSQNHLERLAKAKAIVSGMRLFLLSKGPIHSAALLMVGKCSIPPEQSTWLPQVWGMF